MIWAKALLMMLLAATAVSAAAINAPIEARTSKAGPGRLVKLADHHAKRSGQTHAYTNRKSFGDHLELQNRPSPYNKYHDKPDGSKWPVTHVYAFDHKLNATRLITPDEHRDIEARGFTEFLSGAWEVISSPWVAIPVGIAVSAYFGPVVLARWANLWNGWQRARRFNAFLLAAPQDVILNSETLESAIGLTQITVRDNEEKRHLLPVDDSYMHEKRFDVPSESSHKVNVISQVDGSSTQECGAAGTHADIDTEQPDTDLAVSGARDSMQDTTNQNFADTEYELVNSGRTNEFAASYVYTCNQHGAGQDYGT